ncbi:MAG: NAD(P)H-dependent glycerol-3-phosphate dehydrogenase [Shimia sp.]
MKITVIGAGVWGSALAQAWAAAHEVTVWARRAVKAPPGCQAITGHALPGSDLVVLATPAQTTRGVLGGLELPAGVPLVLTAKGVERETLALQTEVAADAAPGHPLAVLSGPSFAADLSAGRPTAVTLATTAPQGADWQAALATPVLRPYLSDDPTGAQIGGAFKNVIAIACGSVHGAGLGASAQAALMSRGFAEMQRLALAMGAQPETLMGLSGLGDLTLSCTSATSRNFSYGAALGKAGRAPDNGTFEGALTAEAGTALARRHGVEMPITDVVAALVAGRMTLEQAHDALLSRPLTHEA